jgi:DNA-binding transcriptional MerR regulator
MSDDASGGAETTRARPRKAATAFRTISEVADDLQIPQHVLRFWESKFPQLKPLKRGGGRRYYRPEDIALLRKISDLLYTQGYTIKGVQRLLRDGGFEEAAAGGVPELPLGDPGDEAEPDEGDMATEALREALQVLEGLAAELRVLAARN